jgi:hypothetical protein
MTGADENGKTAQGDPPGMVRLTDQLGPLVERLTACAEDPMWAEHAEVPKALLRKAAEALEETEALAGHYMAQRDELRSQTLDLALIVGRLIVRMRAAREGRGHMAGDVAMTEKALDYLRRKGLEPSALRA